MTSTGTAQARDLCERREINRGYPLSLEVEYRLLQNGRVVERGFGRTVHFSSARILLWSEMPLPLEKNLELTVAWPVRLSKKIGLKLFVAGQTVGLTGAFTEVKIHRHEFRIRLLPPAV